MLCFVNGGNRSPTTKLKLKTNTYNGEEKAGHR